LSGRPVAAPRPREIFLSHSSQDSSFVTRLTKVLKSHGIRYWYSATHIEGAKQWHDEIGRALRRCDWFVAVLTPASVNSTWVKRELLYALNEDRYNERIIPLLRKPCKHSQLSWTLSEFQFVDFTSDFDAGCRQLLRIWGRTVQPVAHRGRPGKKQ
jgi:TIR domain-containing protein